MKKNTLFTLLVILIGCSQFAFSQNPGKYPVTVPNPYANFFTEAYQKYADVPQGILEAVAFAHSRFQHITHPVNEEPSCTGIPLAYGVMGLTLDGKGYFNNNLVLISTLSGYSVQDIINSPETSILAYAAAFSQERKQLGITSSAIEDQVPVLEALSELPSATDGQKYALNSDIYEMLYFLNTASFQSFYNLPVYKIDMIKVFGAENYKILSSPNNTMEIGTDKPKTGLMEHNKSSHNMMSADYPPALWVTSPNYYTGRSMAITDVAIHDMEGTYAGSISWFQSTSSSVSAHYCIRSSDGQITQMVLESNTAWHVGSENSYTLGIEHEGYAAKTGWYTDPMYYTSSRLVRNHMCAAYGILRTRMAWWPWAATTDYNVAGIPGSCTLIKGHQHYPNQTHTDPGKNWDWDYYYKMVNDSLTTYTTYTASTGNFYDDGGPSGNYNDDERSCYVIAPKGAKTVTVTFSSFSTENTWDYMYIYDGSTVWAPLIGVYTSTNSPGTITSKSNALCFEFRSDCATTSTGWAATWKGNTVTGIASTMNDDAVKVYPNPTNGKFTIQSSVVSQQSLVEVYNMLGQVLFSQSSVINSPLSIDLTNQPSGVYFLKITGEELSYTSKIVKQ